MKKYEESGLRIEVRDLRNPPTVESVDKLVSDLKTIGAEAVWHSAVDRSARALFPSKVFPNCHPEANVEIFHYLIKKVHETGCAAISWHPLHLCVGLAEEHPNWLMKPMPWPGQNFAGDKEKRHCCINSPYGRMLPEFLAEIVTELGFDGVWMDGTTYAVENENPGCICAFCQEKFTKDTNLKMPSIVDFEDSAFRTWINWRYDIFMELWKNIVARLEKAKPGLAVCFNNYRRRKGSSEYHAWATGIPMRPLRLNAVMSGELEGFPGQADVQIKINKAYECKQGAESWWPFSDGYGFVSDADPLPALQAAFGCVSAGGSVSTGTFPGKRPLPALKAVNEAVMARCPYSGGKTIEYAAILASQQTMDFFGKENPDIIWSQIHGANEIMRHAHLQTSVIFDSHLTFEELLKYKVLIIGNAACLSQKQAENIMRYVNAGGVLLACSNAGEFDEMGYSHPSPVLDELFGILKRDKTKCGQIATHSITDKGASSEVDQHISFRIDMECSISDDSEVLAREAFPAVWRRKRGNGWCVFMTGNLFEQYLKAPVARIMRLIKRLLTELAVPAIELSAPMCVAINSREMADGKWAVHLHNAPGSTYANPYHPRNEFIGGPGEVNPVYDLELKLNGSRMNEAMSPLTGRPFETRNSSMLKIPELKLHDIILLEVVK